MFSVICFINLENNLETLLIFLLISILVSFTCSLLESMILSINYSYIIVELEKGKKFATYLDRFKRDIEKPLIAILTMNTFANTIGATGVGAAAQDIWGNEYITLVSIVVTILILTFGEIVPKTIGATFWRQVAPFGTYVLLALYTLLFPVVWLFQFIALLFKKVGKTQEISKHDLVVMSDLGVKEGILNINQSRIIKNLLQFSEITVKDIMTPRTVIITADENTTIKNLYEKGATKHFSRIPLYNDNKDNITGYVLKDEVLLKIIEGRGEEKLIICKREIKQVYDTTPIPDLYQILMEKKEHIAIVKDKHDGIVGLVTMEDLIETILGIEITDEMDLIEDMQKFARKNWEYRARKQGLLIEDSDEDDIKD